MREIMAELMFLTDIVDDKQLDENPQALEVLAEDYTQLFDLVMSRGLLLEEIDQQSSINLDQVQGAQNQGLESASNANSRKSNQRNQQPSEVVSGLHAISQQQMDSMQYADMEERLFGDEWDLRISAKSPKGPSAATHIYEDHFGSIFTIRNAAASKPTFFV